MGFRFVPKSATLNDLERCNGPYSSYFTDVVVKQLLLIDYDHINTLTARDVCLLPCSWLANQRTTLRGDQIF